MAPQDQILAERPGLAHADGGAASVKSILMHVQDDDWLDSQLQNALSLARAFSAHLTCLHVTPVEAYVAFDTFGGVFVMKEVLAALEENESKLKSRIEDELSDEDVSWDYEQVTGNVISRIVSRAALADLVVTGRAAHRSEFVGAGIAVLGDLLHRSRTPLFIPCESGKPCDPTGPALVAWDGSSEAANAVRSALGMLAGASAVHVVQVEEEKETAFPGTRLLEYLSRHGIHAELTIEYEAELDRNFIPDILVARTITVKASYLVMGGYNHSRLGQYVFGGVTRSMLSASPIPLLIAH